ncbi:hypothetical protein Anapl_08519 [Anas platyrhynchos]|uniref:Uncharacterized protein n=1 Tax=Anas platyrhynchos TaxID=8839 RepID=R0M1I7_ANAPL|nr:hypothetical protein Anapl_08519 [Anas platyrhynchos]
MNTSVALYSCEIKHDSLEQGLLNDGAINDFSHGFSFGMKSQAKFVMMTVNDIVIRHVLVRNRSVFLLQGQTGETEWGATGLSTGAWTSAFQLYDRCHSQENGALHILQLMRNASKKKPTLSVAPPPAQTWKGSVHTGQEEGAACKVTSVGTESLLAEGGIYLWKKRLVEFGKSFGSESEETSKRIKDCKSISLGNVWLRCSATDIDAFPCRSLDWICSKSVAAKEQKALTLCTSRQSAKSLYNNKLGEDLTQSKAYIIIATTETAAQIKRCQSNSKSMEKPEWKYIRTEKSHTEGTFPMTPGCTLRCSNKQTKSGDVSHEHLHSKPLSVADNETKQGKIKSPAVNLQYPNAELQLGAMQVIYIYGVWAAQQISGVNSGFHRRVEFTGHSMDTIFIGHENSRFVLTSTATANSQP